MSEILLQVRDVSKDFVLGGLPWRRGTLAAVEHVNFEIRAGRTLGIVGESGSGKSTLCRLVLGLIAPSSGEIWFNGQLLSALSTKEMRGVRRQMQAVFQNASASFNPRHTVRDVLLTPLEVHDVGTRDSRLDMIEQSLEHVGLDLEILGRAPHSLSGGQRQRVAIARAILLRPSLVIADEPTSALDVSVQAKILNLLKQIQREMGLAYLFVSHNLGVIRYVCDDVAVMYLGRIVETGPTEQVFASPQHPYTQALVEAIPHTDPRKPQFNLPILGELPNIYQKPTGCYFHGRCPYALSACTEEQPSLYNFWGHRSAACLWHDKRFISRAPKWVSDFEGT